MKCTDPIEREKVDHENPMIYSVASVIMGKQTKGVKLGESLAVAS